ncbi:pleckstrin homology domain-containing family B member 2 isoform X1 [Gadus macrocephalus]|uniref:pleckstrin homology domain-containing family B member 2 isoform X2 n=1 Tax=Gadus chalcogrammus TaxID=1042646 RepID=UPI0024C4C985|nr:pleckstrin homology domain-containing family B member 2 isoform X2 [Gadus chalcogrammus]XP_059922927.1 pleckstrin homology domain-containing family B member 2 isoform X1 [Gadus macrocephalus]XP_059922928.1 pleckstrin homology domain-containing family B member 2 isoform X1 [Gadus macrocephalus]XP_059922929.1 pleckstrin homology domain-containing family B member 2 isoform X1 [Gadus macrocephalus]XP_059922930.1 pleckstrin homology domain-containing family B member 2 isoform X1 [Gadus macrocepha
MSIVKSGWLHRQSTILRRWKRNWFDLWADGRLVFYDDQERRDMEDDLHMRVDCINIRGSKACKDLNPPEGKGCDSLLQIVCRDGRVISLCADSSDDALAWTMALQDARVNAVLAPPQMAFAQEAIASAPPPYSEFAVPPQTYNPYGEYVTPPPQATQIVYSADGQPYAVAYPYQYQDQSYPYQYQAGVYPSHQAVNHVIVQERQRDDTGDVALGMLAGAATGLAIGSLFSVF